MSDVTRFTNGDLTIAFSKDYIASGTTSLCGWQNPDLMPALRKLFHCSARERIMGIEIRRDGITARIVTEGP